MQRVAFIGLLSLIFSPLSLSASVFWIGSKPSDCEIQAKVVKRSKFNDRFRLMQQIGEEDVYRLRSSVVKVKEGKYCDELPIEYRLKDKLGDHDNFHKINSVYLEAGSGKKAKAYLVMEYVDGSRIDLLAASKINSERLLPQLLEILIHFAQNEINPYDFAPHNVMLDREGDLRVFDWEAYEVDEEYDPDAFKGALSLLDFLQPKRGPKKIDISQGYFATFDSFESLDEDLSQQLDKLSDENRPQVVPQSKPNG